ncbi:GumC domain-containing protein [Niabella aquatica]
MDNNMQEKDYHNKNFQMETSFEGSSFEELILETRDWMRYLLSKIYLISVFGILGAALGFVYAYSKKPTYKAKTSFVLETNNRNSLAAYANVAATFGIDLGNTGDGLFQGENILELYRSRTMISNALLAPYNFNGEQQLLVDRYIDFNKLRERWERKFFRKKIRFRAENIYPDSELQLLHDSIMTRIVKDINKNYLRVEKRDKKLNIITVTVDSPDELFAKFFNESLVQNVNKFYLTTKTKKSQENVSILQQKVDSVNRIMTGAIYTASSIADATPNQNPTRMTQRLAPIQSATAKAEVNQEILSTLVQNLELSKISLLKETPLIQIVDAPVLPLDKQRVGKLFGLIVGGAIGSLLIILFLSISRKVRLALSKE